MVVVRKADADVLTILHAGCVGKTAQGVDGWSVSHKLRPWPPITHSRHLYVDDLFVDLTNCVVADSPTIENAYREIVYHDIRFLTEFLASLSCRLMAHVQCKGPFVAIPHDVVGVYGIICPDGAIE